MDKLVSVIVPIYKVEPYLNRCVVSIVQQTYPNLEIILVDDGSPDKCPQICDEWALRDDRIKVIHKENGGLSDARNVGIESAKGEFFCFVDSDDYLQPSMITKLMDMSEQYDVKMVLTNFACIFENGERAFTREESPIKEGLYDAEMLFPLLYQRLNWYYIVAWNKIYHCSLFDDIRFPLGRIHEDEYVVAQLMWKAKRIACNVSEEYVYIYKRPGAIMAEKQKERYQYLFEALGMRHQFFIQEGLLADAKRTRQKYFEELEKVACKLTSHGGLSKEEWVLAQKQYHELQGKSKKEKMQWLMFLVDPQVEYWASRKIRWLRGKE